MSELISARLIGSEGILPRARTDGADIVEPGLLIRVMESSV